MEEHQIINRRNMKATDSSTTRRKIHCKQELIVSSLQRFYNEQADIDEILQILQGTSVISLRLIDWFVTNYAKTHSTSYILNNQEFLVYLNYKSQLKAYSKKLFDPFCRRERILFQIGNRPTFLTTVGKLNFFRWAIEKGIINYIRLNTSEIEKEMNTFMRDMQKQKRSLTTNSQSASTTTSTTSTATTTSTTSVVSNATINTLVSQSTGTSKGSTRRRISSKEVSTMKVMQRHAFEVEVRFD
jgi:hypothetical protein